MREIARAKSSTLPLTTTDCQSEKEGGKIIHVKQHQKKEDV